jgi:mono/diheme cytochrome c family protein
MARRILERLKAMSFLYRGVALAIGAWAVAGTALLASGAWAQENLDQGKSPAQLFASDCAICHKTTAGLSKGRLLGLDSFLREHYTASRESAAAIAAYIQATDKGPPATGPARMKKKDAGKGDDKTKKPAAGKSDQAKPGDAKPVDAKPADKPADAEPKPAEPKPSESKPSESKPSDGRPADIYKPEKKSD